MKSKDALKRKRMQSRGELARDDLVDSLILISESEGSMALSSSLMVIVTVVLLDKT